MNSIKVSFKYCGVLILFSNTRAHCLLIEEEIITPDKPMEVPSRPWLFHPVALENYSLCVSQLAEGGCRDKPGKSRDAYHTCYSLRYV